ncbi:mitochondrial oxaloacetate transport protein [Rhexocercosporidium sp. MPI-PUGE-AT-0058]|nr:mitochondrial oxaloacetate transport protein [Rhexocercosporidium sp. MPI-PUGE-AT-0058]
MQLQGELQKGSLQPRIYDGPLHGLKPNRVYEPIRSHLTSVISTDKSKPNFGINVVSGALSGIVGAVLGSPIFLIKTGMQTYSRVAPMGTQHIYRNTCDALRCIHETGGLKGLYRDCNAAIVRTGMGSSVQLPCYYTVKGVLVKHVSMREGAALHLVSSSISGCAVCCFIHPVDTIISRMYNQNEGIYRGIFDCLAKTISSEGFLACYKGFLPHLARILPHTVLTLTLAEHTMAVMKGLKTVSN